MATQKYLATVTNNQDPEKRGRFKVSSIEFLGSDEEIPIWVEPQLQHGWFTIPYKGQQVTIEVDIQNDDELENNIQSLVMSFRPIWKGEVRFTNEKFENKYIVDSKFKDNYTERRGYVTKKGHMIMFDDKDDDESFNITWKNRLGDESTISIDKAGSIALENSSGDAIVMTSNSLIPASSEISVTHNSGANIKLKALGIEMEGTNVSSTATAVNEIQGATVNIAASIALNITSNVNILIDAPSVTLTQGAISAVMKAPEFTALFDAHIHVLDTVNNKTLPPFVLLSPSVPTFSNLKVKV